MQLIVGVVLWSLSWLLQLVVAIGSGIVLAVVAVVFTTLSLIAVGVAYWGKKQWDATAVLLSRVVAGVVQLLALLLMLLFCVLVDVDSVAFVIAIVAWLLAVPGSVLVSLSLRVYPQPVAGDAVATTVATPAAASAAPGGPATVSEAGAAAMLPV